MTIITDPQRAASAIPIVAVCHDSIDSFLAHTSAHTRNWLQSTHFRAKPHTHALLPAPDGGVAEVVVGIKNANDLYALAHLPLALPPGDYALATHHDVLDVNVAALSWGLGCYQFTRYKKASRAPANLVLGASENVASKAGFVSCFCNAS